MDTRRFASAALIVPLVLAACTGSASAPSLVPVAAAPTASPASEPPVPNVAERTIAARTTAPTPTPTLSPAPSPAVSNLVTSYPPTDLPVVYGEASWPVVDTFDQIVQQADLFIVGEVVAVVPGPECCGSYPLPHTDSEIRVTEVGKGQAAVMSTITVQQTGGVYRPLHEAEHRRLSPAPLPSDAPSGAQPGPMESLPPLMLLELDGDPLFRVGERVALALSSNPRLKRYQLVTGPQSRFEVDAQGKVRPVLSDDLAGASVAGLSVDALLARVKAVASE